MIFDREEMKAWIREHGFDPSDVKEVGIHIDGFYQPYMYVTCYAKNENGEIFWNNGTMSGWRDRDDTFDPEPVVTIYKVKLKRLPEVAVCLSESVTLSEL